MKRRLLWDCCLGLRRGVAQRWLPARASRERSVTVAVAADARGCGGGWEARGRAMGGIADSMPPVCGPASVEAAGVATERGRSQRQTACHAAIVMADVCHHCGLRAMRIRAGRDGGRLRQADVGHGSGYLSARGRRTTRSSRATVAVGSAPGDHCREAPFKSARSGFSGGPPHGTGAEATISPQDSRNRGTAGHAPEGVRPRATHHTPGIRRV